MINSSSKSGKSWNSTDFKLIDYNYFNKRDNFLVVINDVDVYLLWLIPGELQLGMIEWTNKTADKVPSIELNGNIRSFSRLSDALFTCLGALYTKDYPLITNYVDRDSLDAMLSKDKNIFDKVFYLINNDNLYPSLSKEYQCTMVFTRASKLDQVAKVSLVNNDIQLLLVARSKDYTLTRDINTYGNHSIQCSTNSISLIDELIKLINYDY